MPNNHKNRRRWVVAGLIVASIVAVAVILLARGKRADVAPSYTVAPVVRGDIVRSVNTTGQLGPLVSVEVSTQVTTGLVTEVAVDFNSEVKKGQVLAKIDPSTFEQRLRQVQANLAAGQADHRLTALNAARMKELHDQDLVTQREYDEAEAQLQRSEASLLDLKAAVQNAQVDLDRCTITSPIDGIVIFKQIEVGKTVVSTMSAPTLFTIAQDLSKMRIIAPISEVDVWAVTPGQAVTFTVDAIADRIFNGRLTQIRNPYTPSDKQSQQGMQQSPIATFDGVIEVDNSDMLLRPSLTANVSIIISRRERVLQVPNGALRVRLPPQVLAQIAAAESQKKAAAAGGKHKAAPTAADLKSAQAAEPNAAFATVYRLPRGRRDATPEPVTVRLGISDSIVTEILDGLGEGDEVITAVPETNDFGGGFFMGM